jgi:hypothetical protein
MKVRKIPAGPPEKEDHNKRGMTGHSQNNGQENYLYSAAIKNTTDETGQLVNSAIMP